MSHPSRLDELDNKGAHLCPECRAQYERMTGREKALAP
jgi:predicted Zn-dependent protease